MGIKGASKIAGVMLAVVLNSQNVDAKIINGVALLVNAEPITLYEIQSVVNSLKVDRQKAIDLLVDMKIEQVAAKDMGIVVGDDEIEDYMFRAATANKMSVYDFENMLTQKGVNLTIYKEDLKNKIRKDRLLKNIVEQSYQEPSDKDLLGYYNLHSDMYNLPNKIKVNRYDSANPEELAKFIQAPLMLRQGVSMQTTTLNKEVHWMYERQK